MRKWLAADLDLGMPGALFFVSRNQLSRQEDEMLLSKLEDKATLDELAAIVQFLIVSNRPELVGGSVVFMTYNFVSSSWEFGYTHPALPRVAYGTRFRRVPLIRADEEGPSMPQGAPQSMSSPPKERGEECHSDD